MREESMKSERKGREIMKSDRERERERERILQPGSKCPSSVC